MNIIKLLKKSQEDLKQEVNRMLKIYGYKKIQITPEYTYAAGTMPVLLVAHLDIAHNKIPELILFDTKKQMLWSPTGIGGDDRCGVYAILEIIKNRRYKPHVLFTTDEEIGGFGATAFTKDIKELPVNFIIEIDRRGTQQAVFYNCGNQEFINYIIDFGFTEEFGTFSDISIISPTYDIASVNLSAGYYNEHTTKEYISLNDLKYTIKAIKQILDSLDYEKVYDFQDNIISKYMPKDYKGETYFATDYLEEDYAYLTDKEFRDFYGFERPATFEDFKQIVGKQ